MNKMMQNLMLSCEKASELTDKKSLFKLSWQESIQLKMHTGMCDACKIYSKQSNFLNLMLENLASKNKTGQSPEIKNEELKNKILSKL